MSTQRLFEGDPREFSNGNGNTGHSSRLDPSIDQFTDQIDEMAHPSKKRRLNQSTVTLDLQDIQKLADVAEPQAMQEKGQPNLDTASEKTESTEENAPSSEASSDDSSTPEDIDPEEFKADIHKACRLLGQLNTNQDLLSLIEPELRNSVRLAAKQLEPRSKLEGRRLRNLKRKESRKAQKNADDQLKRQTGIRQLRARPVFKVPALVPPPSSVDPQCEECETSSSGPSSGPSSEKELTGCYKCYVCRKVYKTLHSFYDQLCPECGDFNYKKRFQTADLRGRTALVTGGRVKIGYQIVMMLLHAGAKVIVVTRFPRDAASRFSKEEDFNVWKDRLEIFGLDLRHTPSVETFCKHLCATEPRLDFLINNACQTVRRPPGFYHHLMEAECLPLSQLPKESQALLESYERMRSLQQPRIEHTDPAAMPVALARGNSPPTSTPGLTHSAEMTQLAVLKEDLDCSKQLFPEGKLDADLQQVDLRTTNSWRLNLAEVQTGELLEVQLVNAVAPFVLVSKLKPLMMRTPERDKHIVNVSAVEGQFYRKFKTTRHPHTNMAKAALNMMTRTSAADYIRDGIHMNSVDTGWVTEENPALIAAYKEEHHHFSPPIDIVDGAARVVDPIFSGFNTGVHVWGQFLKDYKPAPW